MKVFKRDIPARGALAVIGLVTVISLVTGRDHHAGATALSRAPQPERSAPADAARSSLGAGHAVPESLSDLDLAKLKRQNWSDGVANLLGPRPVVTPPPPPPAYASAPAVSAPPPPAPSAPPLPFSGIGKIVESGRTTVFVGLGAEHYEAEAGAVIEQYKVERVTDTQVTFVFRPLGTRQILDVPQPGQQPASR